MDCTTFPLATTLAPPLLRLQADEVIVISRKYGHCPLQTLWNTRKVVTGIEGLADSHFPCNYFPAVVRVGKSTAADQPFITDTVPSRPNEVYQTDVVQAFLHCKLDHVDIYINPPARYQCPAGVVLKLLKAIYGLIQAPVNFKWRKLIDSEVTVILQQTMLNPFG
jgi:hypothetical protein